LAGISFAMISAISHLLVFCVTGLSNGAGGLITATSALIMTSASSVFDYINILNSSHYKQRPWMLPAPRPETFLNAALAPYATTPMVELRCKSMVESIMAMVSTYLLRDLYMTINPLLMENSHSKIYNYISNHRDLISNDLQVRAAAIKDYVENERRFGNMDNRKLFLKNIHREYLIECDRLMYLTVKALTSTCSPPALSSWQVLVRATKSARAVINPSNHQPEKRFHKVAFQLILCMILYEQFTAVNLSYIDLLKRCDPQNPSLRVPHLLSLVPVDRTPSTTSAEKQQQQVPNAGSSFTSPELNPNAYHPSNIGGAASTHTSETSPLCHSSSSAFSGGGGSSSSYE
jgi:hypothetical protein